mmetsp:Transcript_5684/g.15935  ORF Transcript_5684/g.15935 Transcript_5684/m.15935 type:complete len:141 (+) Transcript_5684:400-822(+)
MDTLEEMLRRHQRELEALVLEEIEEEKRRATLVEAASIPEERKQLEEMFERQRYSAQQRIMHLQSVHAEQLRRKQLAFNGERDEEEEEEKAVAVAAFSRGLVRSAGGGRRENPQLDYIKQRIAEAEKDGIDLTAGSGIKW